MFCEILVKISLIMLSSTRLSTIQVDLQARRGVLVRSLDRIFPLDPISSADLLFSILDVPLPIPINLSDPAPPLSDPQRSNINEESIATALGYIAQVVQLLAVYMCYVISYPITYAGSRSLIRDPISTMHGPRMLAIFSFDLRKDVSLISSVSGC
jgi:UV radiation resistance-associated gene protein